MHPDGTLEVGDRVVVLATGREATITSMFYGPVTDKPVYVLGHAVDDGGYYATQLRPVTA